VNGSRPTLDSIARRVGVSKMTVSNAYSRPERLSPRLRETILETARELGYPGPDPVARTLRRRRTGALGFISDDTLLRALSDPYAVRLLQGIAEGCEHAGAGLVLVPWAEDVGQAVELIRASLVDSFVFYSDFDDERLQAVRERRLPFVLIDSPRRPGEAWVGIDDRAAARMQAQHLVDLGHRRVAILSLPLAADRHEGPATAERLDLVNAFHVTRMRLEGYFDVLATGGLERDDVTVYESPMSAVDQGLRGAATLLDRAERPTAILAMSDQLALGALHAAARREIRVPRELSVVGFDDAPGAELAHPPLTTVHQPIRPKGRVAAELLLGDRARDGAIVELPSDLVVRASSGPAPRR
jgi:DNA-binding LacI/PurR family transcriptional regulator